MVFEYWLLFGLDFMWRVMSALQQKAFHCFKFVYETELYLRMIPNVRIQFFRDYCSYKSIRNNSCFSFDFTHDFRNLVIEVWKLKLFRDKTLLDIVFIRH